MLTVLAHDWRGNVDLKSVCDDSAFAAINATTQHPGVAKQQGQLQHADIANS